MLLFAISDVVWTAIIGGAVTVILAVLQIINTHAIRVASNKAGTAAKSAQSSATIAAASADDLNRKADDLAVVAGKTHTLVNSNMGVQLKLNSVVTRRLATLTNDADDMAAAALAEKLLGEHEAKQKAVDAAMNGPRPS